MKDRCATSQNLASSRIASDYIFNNGAGSFQEKDDALVVIGWKSQWLSKCADTKAGVLPAFCRWVCSIDMHIPITVSEFR
jgi:hypothetical protein